MTKKGLLAAGVVVAIAVAAMAGFFYLRRSALARLTIPLSSVSISSPLHGSQIALGSPIVVDATAHAGVPIEGIELWIDGQLMGYQSMGEVGGTAALASFLWSPSTAALHALAARAIGSDGPLGYSPTIYVKVSEPDYEEGAPDTVDYPGSEVLPAAEGVAPVSGPGSAPVMPARPAGGGGGNLPTSQAAGKPLAPALAGQAQGCAARLTFHDLSTDENGFEVFRQASNAQAWQMVAVLQDESGGWVEYLDDASAGGFTYYIASFNEAGSAPSNLVVVNIDPAGCPSDAEASPALTVDLAEMFGASGANQYYFYQSFDQIHWNRLPLDGFFLPGGGGGPQETTISLAHYQAGAETQALHLLLECWGWRGGILQRLGDFSHSFDMGDMSTLPLQISNAQLAGLRFSPLEDAPGGFASIDDVDADPGLFENNLFPELEPTMPFLSAYITYIPELCRTHLMPEAQNLLGKILFCTPYPGFDSGDEGGNPQPYLVWDFSSACPAGNGSPPCNNFEYWLDLAEANDGQVYFNVFDWSTAGTRVHTVSAPGLRNLTLPPVDCDGTRTLKVTMLYKDADQFLLGQSSDLLTIECAQPLPWQIPLEITYETITFSDLDDGDLEPQDVEIYGFIKASTTGGQTRFLNFADWDDQAGDCPDETVKFVLDTGGGLINDGCTKTFKNGSYQIRAIYVCQGTSTQNCSISGWNLDNNVTRVTVDDGGDLVLFLEVFDWDDSSANDLVCWSVIQIPAQSRFEWSQMQDSGFTFIGFDQGSGNCAVTGRINAVLP